MEVLTSKRAMAKRAGVMSFFTFLSRITGLVRDTAIAYFLGAREAADAFYVAFRIPNLLRRLFAEGNLTVSFVPIFTEYLKKSESEAKRVSDITFTYLTLFLILLAVSGVLGASWFVKATAYGFNQNPEKFALTVALTRITFPYILTISLAALCMGILNARFRFGPSAASPIFMNLGIILFAFVFQKFFDLPSVAISWGVLLGGALQLLVQIPYLIKEGFLFKPSFNLFHPGVRRIGKLMVPSIIGSAVYQLNIFAITFMASYLPTGSVSFLWYADRIVEFPMGVFAISFATVALPSFSHLVAEQKTDTLKKSLRDALSLNWFINIPASVGIAAIALPIVVLLFQRGGFDAEASHQTARTVQYFVLGLPFVSANRILTSFFYSIQESRKPVIAAVAAMIVNIAVGYSLKDTWLHYGLAFGVAMGSVTNFIGLIWLLHRQVGGLGLSQLGLPVFKMSLASAFMWLGLWGAENQFIRFSGFWGHLILVLLLMALGVVIYLACALVFKMEELTPVLRRLKRK